MASTPATFPAHLLRLPLLQILRSVGYHTTSPVVLDALTSIAASYMQLLSTTVADLATKHNRSTPTVGDVRLALQQLGAFRPSKTTVEEVFEDEEDMRGVDAFIGWCVGEVAKSNRRMAGVAGETEIEALYKADLVEGDKLDFFTILQHKHTRGAEDHRFVNTAIGKDSIDPRPVRIEGGAESVRAWEEMIRNKNSGMEVD